MKYLKLIKKYWPVILFLVLIFYLGILKLKINKLEDDIQIKNVRISTMQDSVLTYATKTGQLVSKVNSVEIDKRNLKYSLQEIGFNLKEVKNANVKLRNVVAALKAEIKATGSVSTPVIDTFIVYTKDSTKPNEIDSVNYMKVKDWSDGKLSVFDGNIIDNELNFDYQYYLQLKLLVDEQKKGFTVTAVTDTTTTKFVSGNSIFVRDKKKWYERPAVWGVTGILAGVLIAK